MNKLVLIDGHAIMYRAFHAMPALTTKNGEPINAVYGLVSMVLKIVQDLKPTHLAVVFDEKAPTFRKKMLPSYQEQRPPMAKELDSQFEKARNFLKVAKIPVYSKAGFEADDVIGTIATQSSEITNNKLQITEVIIVTGDRDILQLVDDKKNIKLFMPIAGLSSAKLFGEAETIERMGVSPSQIPDYKSLVGDASDNYFGVPGIGPKTANDLLLKYKIKNSIYENLDNLPDKIKEKLLNGKESCDMSYTLATIIRDVPIDVSFDDMNKWDIDSAEVLDLFANNFGFKTLTERVKKVSKNLDQERQGNLF